MLTGINIKKYRIILMCDLKKAQLQFEHALHTAKIHFLFYTCTSDWLNAGNSVCHIHLINKLDNQN